MIVMIMSGFPRQSETFALNELLALQARGLLAEIFATKPGDGASLQPGSNHLLDRVHILPVGSAAEQAAMVVERLGQQAVTGVHAYFAHFPAEVASLVAQRIRVPYGFSVHARDARKVATAELAARARGAACVIACNPDTADEIRQNGAKVHVIPHGVDTDRFQPRLPPLCEALCLLAVGRLVEKKGFDVLINAVVRLPFPFRLRIVGDGPERGRLAAAIAAAGLTERVELCGRKTHAELPEEYARAHVIVVPSILDRIGDRDGLPNVILEAMASGRPVVASAIGAIRSAVAHGHTGILVPPGDPVTLACALEVFARQPTLREWLGHNGRRRVDRDFELGYCTERFCRLLETTYELCEKRHVNRFRARTNDCEETSHRKV